jgi:hypothetical protein
MLIAPTDPDLFLTNATRRVRRLRALVIVDDYTREYLAIEADQGIGRGQVVGVLEL